MFSKRLKKKLRKQMKTQIIQTSPKSQVQVDFQGKAEAQKQV